MGGYFAQIFSPLLSLLLAFLLTVDDIDIGFEVLLFIIIPYAKFCVFLFAWVDEVLGYWILPRFIPNMTFWLFVADLLVFWLVVRVGDESSSSSGFVADISSFHLTYLAF